MLDGGGGGGGTPWESMTVDAMQQLIQNPSVDKHWELVTGWRRSADLVNQHRSQVQNYRDNLAAVWPPENSKAAAAYLTRLDDLIANLTETYEAAIANYTAFSSATLSISLAQKDMEEIYREYSSNAQLLATYTGVKQEPGPSATPTPSPSPSPSGEQPPVPPGRQEALRQKAVTLLSGVSGELAQAQLRLVRPTLYEPSRRINDPASNDGGAYVAPPLPPITPGIPTETAGSRPKGPSVTFPVSSSVQQGPTPVATQPTLGVQQPGLVLGGTSSPVVTPPSTSVPPLSTLPGGTNPPLPNPGLIPPPNSFPTGGNGLVPPTGNGSGRGGLPREGLQRPGLPGPGATHPMPPGGIIGGPPASVVGRAGGSPTRHVNPVGGVIGEGAPHGRVGGRGMAGEHVGGMGIPYGQAGGRSGKRHDQSDVSHWDPDNPWRTDQGVEPVVLPTREQRIDPGPAIGLN